MNGIIYKATNRYNGYIYIGQTRTTLASRMQQHFRDAKSDSNLFHLALLQYGKEGFEWETLDEFSGTKEEVIHALNVAEEYHILKNKSMLGDKGYNATQGGYSSDKFADVIKRRAQANYGGKQILQYDLDGNFIREFESIAEVCRLFGIRDSKGKKFVDKTWRGYQWREKCNEFFPRKISKHESHMAQSQPVLCYTSDGRFYKVFYSISKAHKELKSKYKVRAFSSKIELNRYTNIDYFLFRYIDNAPEQITVIKKEKKAKEQTVPKEGTPSKRVVQYSREGEFIAEFPSIKAAHRETGVSLSSIQDSCKKGAPFLLRASTRFIWRYREQELLQKIEVEEVRLKPLKEQRKERRVIQYDSNGCFVKIWRNTHAAAIGLGCSDTLIRRSLMGIVRKNDSSIWREFKDDYPSNISVEYRTTPKSISKPRAYYTTQKVSQINENGDVIKVWDNMYQASLQTGESHNLIRKQCMGIRTKKKTPSIWKYYTDSQAAI